LKNTNHIALILLLVSLTAVAQIKRDSLPTMSLGKIAMINQADNYITFPTDIGNIAPLMFEANISPSFVIRQRKDSRLMAVLTSQIIIRMYNEESFPIRTPSYKPQVSFYYLTGSQNVKSKITIFGKIVHHSNGQDGDFYNEAGAINLATGNFSTNYFEIGLIKTTHNLKLNAVKALKSSFEIHPKSWMLDELKGQYSGFRWHNSFTAFKLSKKEAKKNKKPNFSIKAETMYMLDAINDWGFVDVKRLNAGLTFYYHPKFLEEVGLFLQFYHGRDYYNIYFDEQLDVIRFGIMTEILRF